MLSIEEAPEILIVPKNERPIGGDLGFISRSNLVDFGLKPTDPAERIYERVVEMWQNKGLVFFRRKDGKVLAISPKRPIVTTVERIGEADKAIEETKEKVLKFLKEAT